MSKKKYFGTDGIRGRVGVAPITPEFILKLGWAIGSSVSKNQSAKNIILIGKDTRRSGYMFESALQAGIMAAGVAPGLLGPMPTPAISYLTRTMHAVAGIVISASHNPHYDNGIKIFCNNGMKLPDAKEHEIESLIDKEIATIESEQMMSAFRINNADGRYIEYCKSTFSSDFWLDNMKIVLDCANGSTYKVAPEVFREIGANVIAIHADPDGLNINDKCGSTHPESLKAKVLETEADLGIAFDGDGDRVLFVDSTGETLDGDYLMFLISEYLRKKDQLKGVVGTLLTNYAIEQYYKDKKVPFKRVNVGDRFVIEGMKQHQFNLGGEPSGHIICGDISSTGDGIVAALYVLQALKHLNEPLDIAKRIITMMPQISENIEIKKQIKAITNTKINSLYQKAQEKLGQEGRIILRPSGTEPKIRVMVECQNLVKGKKLIQPLIDAIKAEYQ